jgi:bacillithiol biosynthesis cysteine-adding enzyme BshC
LKLKNTAAARLCIDPAWHGILKTTGSYQSVDPGFVTSHSLEVNALHLADCHPIPPQGRGPVPGDPIAVAPGLSRLYSDFCAGEAALEPFFGFVPSSANWQAAPQRPPHWSELVEILAAQNPSESAGPALNALRSGAGAVLTGQQVGLFGGPLFTPLKAATALARARQATQAGRPHATVFWLATEDHDFAEINHVTFPSRRELKKLVYETAPQAPVPVGGVVLDETINPLIDQAWELLGSSDAMDALAAAYKPGHTFAQAFTEFYAKVFAAQGLLILNADGRELHRMGAPVLRAALEQADEFHAALVERNRALEAAGYHAQVAVAPQSSLLFLIDERTDARLALKRTPPSPQEPNGLWQSGRERYSTADLVGILDAAPERISPSALLRPVFQDYLLGTSLTIGGPAEIAYFAQSAVLFEKILGRMTPAEPRFSATLIEPEIGELLRKHDLTLDRVFNETADSLAQLLAARAMPIEGKRKIASAGIALDNELAPLLEWLRTLDAGLGRSAETAANKMRYQMNRLRRIAANFQLQKEESIKRHAEAISRALYPGGVLQERLHGAAYYFARYGFDLAERLTTQAMDSCAGHTSIWL